MKKIFLFVSALILTSMFAVSVSASDIENNERLQSVRLGTFGRDGVLAENDDKYDWGYSIMKKDGTYKAWWTRQDPHDTIWYAESNDGINWFNAQKVMTPAESDWGKIHAADPTVIYLNNRYYMYYESNRTTSPEATDSNIFLATSTDGINWNKYPNNSNPIPVIQVPNDLLGKGYYGVGQPSVYYKDNQFIMYYTYACNPEAGSSGGNVIARAISSDGINWGNINTHQRLVTGASAEVRYSIELNEYLMFFTRDNFTGQSSISDKDFNFEFHMISSKDGVTWPASEFWNLGDSSNNITEEQGVKLRIFGSVITNPLGLIEGKTIYPICTIGDINQPNEDFKIHYTTWDGELYAVQLNKFLSESLTLPENMSFKSESNGTIYRMENGKKKSYTGWGEFADCNNGKTNYITLSDSIVNAIENGGNTFEGLNVRTQNADVVYKIYDNKKWPYYNYQIFEAINGDGSSHIYTIDENILNSFPTSSSYYLEGLNVINDSGSIFKIKDGTKNAYVNSETFLAINNGNSVTYSLPNDIINQIPSGYYYMNNLNILNEGTGEILYCYDNTIYNYADWEMFLDKNKEDNKYYKISSSLFNQFVSEFKFGGNRP